MMKIAADPNIPFVREAFSALGEIQLVPGRKLDAAVVRDADLLLVRSVTPVNAALLDGSKVRFVATATIGFDHVDRDYLAKHGIGFASAAGSNANSVAEYVVAALLELAHRGKFRISDRTIGVVGVGNVGQRLVRYAEALGMRVLQNDPPRQRAEELPHFVSLDRVFAEADIVTLHVPLTKSGADATFHLLNERNMTALTRRPILINTARGAAVDNPALLRAIMGGKFSGVVLDVWEGEPNILLELLAKVDLGTPHIAGYSFDGKVNGTQMIYRAACEFLGLQPVWDPSPLMPSAPVPKFEVDVRDGENEENVLRCVVKRIYDISLDDAALRSRTREFDRLRAEYLVRREFYNATVVLRGGSESLRGKLKALGFRLV